MEEDRFLELLVNGEYDELEKELYNLYIEKSDLKIKYQLGVCYSKQFDKKDKAKRLFKELMSKEYRQPYMYYFIAKDAKENVEKVKIIKEGLRCFPNNTKLKNCLVFYLEDDEKEEYFKMLKEKSLIEKSSIIEMISYYYEKENYLEASNLFKKIEFELDNVNLEDFKLIQILCRYLNNEKIDLDDMNSLIIVDRNTINGIILRLVEIDLVSKENISKAKQLLKQVGYWCKFSETFIEIIDFSVHKSSVFQVDGILFDIIDKLIAKFDNEEEKRKLRLIQSLHGFYWGKCKNTKVNLKLIEKDLKDEIKSTDNRDLYNCLLDIYQKLSDNKKYFITYINIVESCSNKVIIDFDKFDDLEIEYVVDYICDKIIIYDYNREKYQKLITLIIRKLFERKEYFQIVRIAENINYKILDYLDFGFELAYSYVELNKDKEAIELYEEYIKENPNSHASINNLGVIYEKEGNYEYALELYEKAKQKFNDKLYMDNIKKCKNLIEQRKKEESESIDAVPIFEKENIWVINELKLFYSACDENDNVICSYKKLPILLKCSDTKAQELLNIFLDKKYIFKNKNHKYNTNSNVYKINKFINNKIKELEKENMLVSAFTKNLNNFTIENLRNLNYIEIYQKLSNIKEEKIRDIFTRDYNELIYNYLSNQSKTVVLMSGTIIELLLLYILEINGIVNYNVGAKKEKKKVEKMDISEMLEVCTSEKLIHNVPQKFIDGVKNFRNFVHPGRELRENLLEIDKQTVDVLMSIVRWLILTLNLS